MRDLRPVVRKRWMLTALLLGVPLALGVLVSGTGVAGAGVAATIWVCVAGWLWSARQSTRSEEAAYLRELRDDRAAQAKALLDNAEIVRDCLRELADQFEKLVAILQTTAWQDWGNAERADYSRRFTDFATERRLIPRLHDAVARLHAIRSIPEAVWSSGPLGNLIAIGDSALGVAEQPAGRKQSRRSWVDLDPELSTWSELNQILQLLRSEPRGPAEEQEISGKLAALADRLKQQAPPAYWAEMAERDCRELRSSLGEFSPG